MDLVGAGCDLLRVICKMLCTGISSEGMTWKDENNGKAS